MSQLPINPMNKASFIEKLYLDSLLNKTALDLVTYSVLGNYHVHNKDMDWEQWHRYSLKEKHSLEIQEQVHSEDINCVRTHKTFQNGKVTEYS